MRAADPRRRGFTLVEMLVVVAIFSVVVTAAVSIVTVVLGQRRSLEQTISVYDAVGVSSSLVEFDLASAGWRFPASAFAVRVVNNVGTSTSLAVDGFDLSSGQITTAAHCSQASWGLVPGSDVLEVAEGYAGEPPGVVQFVDLVTPAVVLKGSTNPLTAVATSAVVMFSDGAGNACLGRVTTASVVGSSVPFTYLAPDYTTENTPEVRYVSKAGDRCPTMNMNIYRLGKRTRYMLCKNPSSSDTPTLFRQVSDDTGSYAAASFQQVQPSIADLQVAIRVQEGGSSNLGPSSACTVVAGSNYCTCNATGACTGQDGNGQNITFNSAQATVTNAASHLQWVRGLQLGLTAASARQAATGEVGQGAQYLRPALLDHAAATGLGTGFVYVTTMHSVTLNNFVLVMP